MSDEVEVPWVPQVGESVRVLHDACYRRVPSPGEDHESTSWEGEVGEIIGLDGEKRIAAIRRPQMTLYGEGDFPFDDIIPLDRLKRPEGAEDGAWVQIKTGKYDGKLAQIRGWRRGRLHIQRADGPVEAYLPEEVMLVGDPGVDMDVSRATPPVGLRGGEPSAEK